MDELLRDGRARPRRADSRVRIAGCSVQDHARDLSRAATSRTRGLILNSPCNPTGAVYSHAELTAIARFADERGWWILSDEIYREISYEGEAPSLLSVARRHRTVDRRRRRREIVRHDRLADRMGDRTARGCARR